jgi:hypothetical protein
MTAAFTYVGKHGIDTEENYKYNARDNACHHDGGEYKISTHEVVPREDCATLA